MSEVHQRFINSLLRSQWLSPSEIDQYQVPLIENLVRHAATQSAFYRERLAPLFDGEGPASAPVKLARWEEVPPVTRGEIAANPAALHARSVPPAFGQHRAHRSSGTTTIPLEHLRSDLASVAVDCLNERAYLAHALDLLGTLVLITHTPDQPEIAEFASWNKTNPSARMYAMHYEVPLARQLDLLRDVGAAHVMTYPNHMRALGHEARRRGAEIPQFATLISSGELLDESGRTEICDTFGCRIIDLYATREFGQIAFQCPEAGVFHVAAECVLVELLDAQDRPVPPGELGRVVVTGLYNYAMPFIRYDVGDYAVSASEPCICGRGLPVLTQIGGRTRNLFVMPDGSKVWPRLGPISKKLVNYLPYADIQFIQHDINLVELRYVPRGDAAGPDHDGVQKLLQSELHPAVVVQLSPVSEIARGPGGKVEQFITRVT